MPEWVKASHVILNCSTPLASAKLGLGVGLVGEMWAHPYCIAAPTGEHKSQGWGGLGWTRWQYVAYMCVLSM